MRSFLPPVPLRWSCALVLTFAVTSLASAQTQPRRLTAVRDLFIDAATADLTRVSTVLVNKAGDIIFAQGQDHVLRYFDARGVPFVFGRGGDGPGEFRINWDMSMIGDTVVVTDPSLRRLTFIGPDRKLLRTTRHPTTISRAGAPPNQPFRFAGLFPRAVYPDGSLLVKALLPPASSPQPDWVPANSKASGFWINTTADGTFRRVIAETENLAQCIMTYPATRGLGAVQIPFCVDPPSAYSPDGTRLAFTSWNNEANASPTYRLTVLNWASDTVIKRDYPYVPVPVAKRTSDSVMSARLAENASRPQALEAYRKLTVPKTYPPLRKVIVGRDNTIWLETWSSEPGHHWLVLDDRGNPVATLTLPPDISIAVAQHSTIWALQTDPTTGLQAVARYQLRP